MIVALYRKPIGSNRGRNLKPPAKRASSVDYLPRSLGVASPHWVERWFDFLASVIDWAAKSSSEFWCAIEHLISDANFHVDQVVAQAGSIDSHAQTGRFGNVDIAVLIPGKVVLGHIHR